MAGTIHLPSLHSRQFTLVTRRSRMLAQVQQFRCHARQRLWLARCLGAQAWLGAAGSEPPSAALPRSPPPTWRPWPPRFLFRPGCHGAAPGPASPRPPVCVYIGQEEPEPQRRGTRERSRRPPALPPSPPGGAPGDAAWRWCWRLFPGAGGSAGPGRLPAAAGGAGRGPGPGRNRWREVMVAVRARSRVHNFQKLPTSRGMWCRFLGPSPEKESPLLSIKTRIISCGTETGRE